MVKPSINNKIFNIEISTAKYFAAHCTYCFMDLIVGRKQHQWSIAQTLDGSIITGKHQVFKLIIENLKNIDKHLTQKQLPRTKELPELPPSTEEELQKTLKHISTKKALTKFPVTDELIHLIPSNKLSIFFNEIWNPNFIETFPELFDCKLIPLNKK